MAKKFFSAHFYCREEEPKVAKAVLENSAAQWDERCFAQCASFTDFLHHLKIQHSIELVAGLQYCLNCNLIFVDEFDSCAHFLRHALNVEQQFGPDSALDEKAVALLGKVREASTYFGQQVKYFDSADPQKYLQVPPEVETTSKDETFYEEEIVEGQLADNDMTLEALLDDL